MGSSHTCMYLPVSDYTYPNKIPQSTEKDQQFFLMLCPVCWMVCHVTCLCVSTGVISVTKPECVHCGGGNSRMSCPRAITVCGDWHTPLQVRQVIPHTHTHTHTFTHTQAVPGVNEVLGIVKYTQFIVHCCCWMWGQSFASPIARFRCATAEMICPSVIESQKKLEK